MTVEDIQAREKAATPGPLELSIDGTYIWRTEAPAQLIARFENKVDARFYFHAREDIPYLLAQLRDREEKLEAVRAWGQRNRYQDAWPDLRDWPGFDRILKGGD